MIETCKRRRAEHGVSRLTALALGAGVALGTVLPNPAHTQTVMRISAVVNEDVVSAYDIQQRLNYVVLIAGIDRAEAESRGLVDQIRDQLINERLQVQEAERLGIDPDHEAVEAQVNLIAQAFNTDIEDFELRLRGAGVDPQTLHDQVRAEISWTNVIRSQLLRRVQVAPLEIDTVLTVIESEVNQPNYLLRRLVLIKDDPARQQELRNLAERLRQQILDGASFISLARQFSQGVLRQTGGTMDWTAPASLDPAVATALVGAQPGDVLPVIETPTSIILIEVRDIRAGAGDATNAQVTLKQLVWPVTGADETAAMRSATAQAAQLTDCSDMDAAAQALGTQGSGDVGTVRVADLPASLRRAVVNLPVDRPSAPVRTALGISVMMVCERVLPEAVIPSRDQIRSQILNERIMIVARRHLRDLRIDANIEIR